MSDYTRVSWYEHDCDWITKYCDDHHTRSALIPTAALAVLGDRDALREKIARGIYERFASSWLDHWDDLDPGDRRDTEAWDIADAVLDVLYGEEKDV